MKTRIALGCYLIMLLLAFFPKSIRPAAASPQMAAIPVSFQQRGFFSTGPAFMGYATPAAPPHASHYPLVSAQQACLRENGWNWRQGQFAMCFKPGHTVCPAGYPWMRQTTQRYTICLSGNSPEQLPPPMGRY